jgi:hypothetical protein
MKTYSIRKMGTRRGQPHYGVSCMLCSPTPGGRGRILRIGHLSKLGAETVVRAHMLETHGRTVLAPKPNEPSSAQ